MMRSWTNRQGSSRSRDPSLRIGIPGQTDQGQHAPGLGPHSLVVQPPAARAFVAQEEVLGNGQVVGQVELLVDQHDPGRFGIA